MKPEFPILDNHMHLDPKGFGIEAARKFQRAGGTHFILVHKPYNHIPRHDFKRQFQTTLNLAEKVRTETNLTVFTSLSPHPAELTTFIKKRSLGKAKKLIKDGIDLAANYISQGIVLCFGEAGRPHYPVDSTVWGVANDLIAYTMEKAKDLDCAIQFHTEGGEASFRDIASIANDVGFRLDRCVKHFSGPSILEDENHGLFPSVVARKGSIKKALGKGTRFCMETDYIDDKSRPNVVLPPTTVPEITLEFLKSGELTVDMAYEIHQEHPESVYKVEIERL